MKKSIWIALMVLMMFFAAESVQAKTIEDALPMYRLYNPNSGEHFYTANAAEQAYLTGIGWYDEGIGWYAPAKSQTPVYRLYNPNAGDHHYTMSAGEKEMLVKVGWSYEGIGWYSDDEKGEPLYRQYNPNARAGSHNYTTNKAENDMLVRVGWREEGIGWYGAGKDLLVRLMKGESDLSDKGLAHQFFSLTQDGSRYLGCEVINNTGKDISFQCFFNGSRKGEDYPYWNGLMGEHPYIKNGEKYVFAMDLEDTYLFEYFFEIGEASEAARSFADHIKMTASENADRTVSVSFTSDEGGTVLYGELFVFYYDKEGEILRYDTVRIGEELPLSRQFAAPPEAYDHFAVYYSFII